LRVSSTEKLMQQLLKRIVLGAPKAIYRVWGPLRPPGGHHRTASDWGIKRPVL
jgi:hypothetical protein